MSRGQRAVPLVLSLIAIGCAQDGGDRHVRALQDRVRTLQRELSDAKSDANAQRSRAETLSKLLDKQTAEADRAKSQVDELIAIIDEANARAHGRPNFIQRPASTQIAQAPVVPTSGKSEWQRMEEEQKQKQEAWRRRLSSTTVYVGGDSSYHTSSCDSLYVFETTRFGTTTRRFAGRSITLQSAFDQRLSRHSCGPPSYEFSYQD